MRITISMVRFLFFLFLIPFSLYANEVFDLTHSFNQQTIYWPTASGFELEKRGWKVTSEGYFYAANIFKTPEHGGTHRE